MGTLRYLVVTEQRNCSLYCKKTPVLHFYAICKPDRLAFCFSLKMGGDYEARNFRLEGTGTSHVCGARLKHGTKILKVSAGRFSLVSPQTLFVYIPFSMRLCSPINTLLTLTKKTATASSLIVRIQEIFQSFEFFHTGHRFTNQERHCIRNVLPWTEREPRPLNHAM